jgi:hypothetical protein
VGIWLFNKISKNVQLTHNDDKTGKNFNFYYVYYEYLISIPLAVLSIDDKNYFLKLNFVKAKY